MIQGCIRKKQECEKLLFDRYSRKMMSVCMRYVNNTAEAEDILQEGFMRVFSQVHQYKFQGSFEGWMRKLFANIAIRALSKRKMNFTDVVDLGNTKEQSIEASVFSKISTDEIYAMVRSMPDGYRTVFNLNVIEGFSHEEIASIMKIQPATSRGQLAQAKKYLQALILKKYNSFKSIIL
jgi:RNA polymerase sigma factor (sigma-70 family)